jgi:glycosyltransferase involved in cell wall biosynthesis
MSQQLPIAVLLPTFNVMDRIGAHLEMMRSWLDSVAEIVVVDSHSTDGSAEFIQKNLRHPALRVLQHPPGLYQSWNHGISQITAPYTYISTIGETITEAGLGHLVATARTFDADVVLSRPRFFSEAGHPVHKRWPLHDYLEEKSALNPGLMSPADIFFFATADLPESIAGSAASNLYRTETLRRFPFPTDCGHWGDEAWFIAHACEVSVAVTPRIFSTFLLHPSGNRMPLEKLNELVGRMDKLAENAMSRMVKESRGAGADPAHSALCEFTSVRRQLGVYEESMARVRGGILPWALNPSAWKLRSQRNSFRRKFKEAKGRLNAHRGPVLEDKSSARAIPEAVEEKGLAVSVFVCTHNPHPAYLRQTLGALRAQTLPASRWELRLVDNASSPSLNGQYDVSWHRDGRMLREEKVGKVNALQLAFQQTASPLVVIVDDDNVLAPDFLERAVNIARRHPGLGAWGGIVELQFEHEPEPWTRKYWTFLAEQKVPQDLLFSDTKISGPLPVGAGSCIRREVMKHYFEQIEKSAWRQKLGRTGATLMSGEDTDMVLTAGDMGLGCGFFKELQLKHLIPPSRLSEGYLTRLVEGIAFSTYVLRMMRDPLDAPPRTNLIWWAKFLGDCSAKFGRRRRFYLANKRAQRKAREVYDNFYSGR